MPTEQGLALFEVLGRADPALVDPGVTAELERLLDDVLTGKQRMRGAIDAVCDAATRIIGKLTQPGMGGVTTGTEEALGASAERPPTAAMRKFAAAIARNKGIELPARYTKSAAVCRAFLDRHAPRRGLGEGAGSGGGGASPGASGETAPKARQGRRRTKGAAAKRKPAGPGRAVSEAGTPLRIPYGNKEIALKLGARYGAGGWFAPPGVDLSAFRERGWL